MHRVYDGLDREDVLPRDLREVRPLREPASDDAVDILDGVLLVRGARPRVVDGTSENPFEGLLVRDLAAVVRGRGLQIRVDGAALYSG